jgi:hypothetical protein
VTERDTQAKLLLRSLKGAREQGVSAYEAFMHMGIYRCGARVYDLKRQGHTITTERRPGKTAIYRLVDSPEK